MSTWLLLLCLVLMPAVALSADEASDVGAAAGTLDTLDILGFGDSLSADELGVVSGRQNIEIGDIDIQASDMQVNADMDDNVLYSRSTGANSVTRDAFTNAQGIATVIQNSGNQVIINNSMILNVRVE